MSTLIAKRYRTTIALKLADHTYVECGNGGKAWSCWGGKTGGSTLRQAKGSTARADAIAEPDERAGITCYLINGVCHQAANRILRPARIIVRGAKGYWLSSFIFNTYGRPRSRRSVCSAPLYQHAGVTGDIAECTEVPVADLEPKGMPTYEVLKDESNYLDRVASLYERIEPAVVEDKEQTLDFQLEHLALTAAYRLGSNYDDSVAGPLLNVQRQFEQERDNIEESFEHKERNKEDFLEAFNRITIDYQLSLANQLKPEHYRALFADEPGDTVVLGDPKIMLT